MCRGLSITLESHAILSQEKTKCKSKVSMLLSVMPQLIVLSPIHSKKPSLFRLLPIALITGSDELLSMVLFLSFHKVLSPCVSDLDGGEGKRTDHLVIIIKAFEINH